LVELSTYICSFIHIHIDKYSSWYKIGMCWWLHEDTCLDTLHLLQQPCELWMMQLVSSARAWN
jgi:hypothetical protein